MMIQTTRRGLCSECQKLNINWNPSPTCSTNTRPLENHRIIPDTFGNLLKTQTFYKLDTKHIVYLRGRRDPCRRSRTFLASLVKKQVNLPKFAGLDRQIDRAYQSRRSQRRSRQWQRKRCSIDPHCKQTPFGSQISFWCCVMSLARSCIRIGPKNLQTKVIPPWFEPLEVPVLSGTIFTVDLGAVKRPSPYYVCLYTNSN
jgi:hypothetical protein